MRLQVVDTMGKWAAVHNTYQESLCGVCVVKPSMCTSQQYICSQQIANQMDHLKLQLQQVQLTEEAAIPSLYVINRTFCSTL